MQDHLRTAFREGIPSLSHRSRQFEIIYRTATDRLGVEPQDCLYIGDGSSRELSGASQVGMQAVLIRAPDEVLDAHVIDREEWQGKVISSLEDVLSLVE